MIDIIPFEEEYAAEFRKLNVQWLQEYFEVETYDEHQLSHPLPEIIDKGRYIFLAMKDDKIVGTAALMKETDVSFELTKMSVTKNSQGKGISKMLMDACLKLAKDKKCNRLSLYSNTKLATAIRLYHRYAFTEIPLETNSHYASTNIKMELKLT